MTQTSFIKELPSFLQDAWKKEGFQAPTSVQEQVFPYIMNGQDVIAESPTGTGKTLAYLLPLLTKLDAKSMQLQTVILASSRELVMQIHQEIQNWTTGTDIRCASFIGGANSKRQLEKLKKKPHIVVGTPGKVYELIQQKKMKMHEVKTIVLDEGDTLLVPEHFETVTSIIKSTMKDRQLLLFSATVNQDVATRLEAYIKEPATIAVKKDATLSGQVEHIYFVCEKREKLDVLEKISRLPEVKALVFMKDIVDMEYAASKMKFNKMKIAVLSADGNKSEREQAIKGFRKGLFPMMLSTDVAARGLDIKGLTTVVHFDLPRTLEQYTHRSGRTGRAGNDGVVISIITASEEKELKQLAKKLNIQVSRKDFFKGGIVDERKSSSERKPSARPTNRSKSTFKKKK